MKNADIPYRPEKCSHELSNRIMRAAVDVRIYATVTHLLALKNLAPILDGVLYGRGNLINSYTDFRPASLGLCDIVDGDFNAICCGMDKIDLRCFVGGSVGLEFKLDALTDVSQYNKNPAIFFKQRDFGYHFDDIQQIKLKKKSLFFSITRRPENNKSHCVSLRIFNSDSKKHSYPIYSSSVPKYSFISNNVHSMDSILKLNFFRFLDTLKDTQDRDVNEEIRNIYEEIESLDDQELIAFLTDVGKKMSCSSKFNFSGAYKIDLNAIKSIRLYNEQNMKYMVEMDSLYEELSQKKVVILKQLIKHIPELFKSDRFRDHLSSKAGAH
ncbi:MAG: hypothetical protein H0T62_14050 [Parachlamydiaceae bacterium]|nr:hypothetical protein [Parachlamydiaceae bacterium]